jgi:hypothetical protein
MVGVIPKVYHTTLGATISNGTLPPKSMPPSKKRTTTVVNPANMAGPLFLTTLGAEAVSNVEKTFPILLLIHPPTLSHRTSAESNVVVPAPVNTTSETARPTSTTPSTVPLKCLSHASLH